MTVRAKFQCYSISRFNNPKSVKQEDGSWKTVPYETHTIVLVPAYSNDPNDENKKFWDATPGGKLEMNCVNPEAVKQFDIGKYYYIDITPSE